MAQPRWHRAGHAGQCLGADGEGDVGSLAGNLGQLSAVERHPDQVEQGVSPTVTRRAHVVESPPG